MTPNKLLYNMIHNLGDLYDSIEAIVKLTTKESWDDYKYFDRLGRYSGAAMFAIAYKPSNFNPFDGK